MPFIMVGRAVTLTSESQAGGALPSNWVGVGASDGSLFQALLVETAANPNLRVGLYDGSIRLGGTNLTADGTLVTSTGLNVVSHLKEFNNSTFDRIRHSFNQSTAGVSSNGVGAIL